ncbi:MAG: 30S ribosomal protein S1 [Schleiferiaceae bacterium]|jgi:small subunit ribosomal protein S1
MSEELNPELEGQIQEQAAEAAATPEVEVAEVAAAVEAVEDGSDEDELELVLEPEEEEVAFDWNAYETGYGSRSEEHKALEQLYEATLVTSVEHQVVNGIVVQLTDRDAIIDISSKSEGVVSLNEFRYNPDLKVGDVVEVLVDKQEDKLGQLVLSHRKARSIKAWDRVNEAFEAEEIVQGYVKARTKGGMIVDVFGLEAFLPGSQIDVKPIRDYDIYVDKTMEFKIVKINHEFKNVVVSHKALIEADLEEQKRKIIGQLEKGQVLEGVVKNITSYGVFIDLGGVDGLVHITDLSWSRINHPSEVVELDQKLNVVILDFDEAKTRIQLGLKQLSAHPWEALDASIQAGDTIKGKVVVLADYGAFIEVAPGVEGLVHVSEMSWGSHLRSAQDFFKVGDEVQASVLSIDREERKMSLGIKQLTPDPWASITAKYPVGSVHTGKVRNFTNFGVFVELEEGIDGLIHISDLSWLKKVKHPSEFTSVGAELEVKVLDIDVDNRRLSLGHKQVADNPWDNLEDVFAVGSSHTGTVKSTADKGFNIWFPNQEIEAYCPPRHASKEDNSSIAVGEELEFRVIEFNRDSRRILVSHTQSFKGGAIEEGAEGGKGKKGAKGAGAKTTVQSINAQVEKATLGDLDSLARLKEEMEGKE